MRGFSAFDVSVGKRGKRRKKRRKEREKNDT